MNDRPHYPECESLRPFPGSTRAVCNCDDIDRGPGTPTARLEYLLEELERRFPGVVSPNSSEAPEPKLLAAIDNLLAKNAAPPRCRMRWRAGVLSPPGVVPIPEGARCTLPPHGDDIEHQFRRP